MTLPEYAVVLAFATSYALRAEKILNQAGIESKLIPVPRHLSSDCGVCVRILNKDIDRTRQLLHENHCEFEGIYPLPPGDRG